MSCPGGFLTRTAILDFNGRNETETISFDEAFERGQNPDSLFELGVSAEDNGDLRRAAQFYEKALLIGGPQEETSFNLGNVYYGLNRTSEAIQRYRQAVEIDPEYVEAWNNLGVAFPGDYRRGFESRLAQIPTITDTNVAFRGEFFGLQHRRWPMPLHRIFQTS